MVVPSCFLFLFCDFSKRLYSFAVFMLLTIFLVCLPSMCATFLSILVSVLLVLWLWLSLSDVKDVGYVINYDFPNNCEDYIHRIGRTGRAGMKGTSYTYFTTDNAKSARELVGILKEAKAVVPPQLEEMTMFGGAADVVATEEEVVVVADVDGAAGEVAMVEEVVTAAAVALTVVMVAVVEVIAGNVAALLDLRYLFCSQLIDRVWDACLRTS
ncbi:hypothetical protein BDZ89DRAFT_106711 [Hymenopellis radicata]|nr:hypothetical protein BDZ89DRAFT_106711 [Hymenopellis radicata]